MKLKIKDGAVDLSLTKVMGIIDVHSDGSRSLDDYVARARQMQSAGAEFVQAGMTALNPEVTPQEEEERLIPVIERLSSNLDIHVGVCTTYPQTMEKAKEVGASFIVDPNALRREGAVEMAAKLQLPVVLIFNDNINIEDDPKVDLVAEVSEFFFERIDTCLNAGLSRKLIIIDPSMSFETQMEQRLKLLGRLESFRSFALPLSLGIPRSMAFNESLQSESRAVSITLAVFCSNEGVNIIRTREVADMAMSLATWQLAANKARPFQLSKSIIRRFRSLRDSMRQHRLQRKMNKN